MTAVSSLTVRWKDLVPESYVPYSALMWFGIAFADLLEQWTPEVMVIAVQRKDSVVDQ